MGEATLSPARVGRVYDRIGRVQDWQRVYEGPAISDLVASADFEHAHSVFEVGCGTGAMADALLDHVLPADAAYTGVDVSPKMVHLASDRLRRFGDRARIELVGGQPPFPAASAGFDRFVAVYVFDLLSDSLASEVLHEADRLLTDDGRLCIVSLTNGTTLPSKIVCSLWNRAWQLAPAMVGGCRPTHLAPLLKGWEIVHAADVTAWAVPSQIIVATRADRGA